MSEPGLHSLIVGVSKYPYLLGGESASGGRMPLRIRSLASSATSAFLLHKWVEEHAPSFPVPLASQRLLLSPTEEELERFPKMAEHTTSCTIDDFMVAVSAWRRDALRHADGMALFYFAGHGVQASAVDDLILLQDFGSGVGTTMRGAVSVGNLFYGMSATVPTMARTQLYFIDASRVAPRDAADLLPGVTRVLDAAVGGSDDRNAVVFAAASPGGQAYQLRNEGTLFQQALIEGLDGKAAVLKRDSRASWCVTVSSLSRWMVTAAERTSNEYGLKDPLGYSVSGNIKDPEAVISSLDRIPSSRVTVEIMDGDEFDADAASARIVLESEKHSTFTAVPGVPIDVPAGFYLVGSDASSPLDVERRILLVSPPEQHIVLQRAAVPETA